MIEERADGIFVAINKAVGDEIILSNTVAKIEDGFHGELICNLLNEHLKNIESNFEGEME